LYRKEDLFGHGMSLFRIAVLRGFRGLMEKEPLERLPEAQKCAKRSKVPTSFRRALYFTM
jgi:hypothetical protein